MSLEKLLTALLRAVQGEKHESERQRDVPRGQRIRHQHSDREDSPENETNERQPCARNAAEGLRNEYRELTAEEAHTSG